MTRSRMKGIFHLCASIAIVLSLCAFLLSLSLSLPLSLSLSLSHSDIFYIHNGLCTVEGMNIKQCYRNAIMVFFVVSLFYDHSRSLRNVGDKELEPVHVGVYRIGADLNHHYLRHEYNFRNMCQHSVNGSFWRGREVRARFKSHAVHG